MELTAHTAPHASCRRTLSSSPCCTGRCLPSTSERLSWPTAFFMSAATPQACCTPELVVTCHHQGIQRSTCISMCLREDSLLYLAQSVALVSLLMCNAGTFRLRLAASSDWRTRTQARGATSPAAATWARASLCCAQPRRRSPTCAPRLSPVLEGECHGLIIDWLHPDHTQQARSLCLQSCI